MSQGRERKERTAALPERLGRYEILLPIARGGMGVVYLARARGAGGFEREVALKLLPRHLEEGESHALDLVEEAKLAVLIRHPNVVQILDVDEGPLGVFMAMEYVEGCSLGGLLVASRERGASLPPEIGLRILLDALAGLHAAHELEGPDGRPLALVHRDFSPQNILVGTDGVSKLADFGIAKARSRRGHTVTGTIKGKVAYMAPEQLAGAPLDRRCDVWAAGVVAWEIMAGRPLYEATDDIAVMYRIAHVPAPRLRASGIDVPVELDETIARALASAPGARCPTAAAFARTLEAAGVTVASPDEVAAHVRRFIGPALADRKARIADLLERRVGARDAAPELQSGATITMAAENAPTTPEPPEGVATIPMHPAGTLVMRDFPAAPAPSRTMSLSTPRSAGSRALRLGAAFAVSLLLAVGAWAAFARTSVRPEPAPAEPERAATPQAPVALEASSPPSPPPVADPPTPVVQPTPKLTGAAPARASVSKAKPKGSARPLPLAASPYERAP